MGSHFFYLCHIYRVDLRLVVIVESYTSNPNIETPKVGTGIAAKKKKIKSFNNVSSNNHSYNTDSNKRVLEENRKKNKSSNRIARIANRKYTSRL
jgi:hypothetical protein